MNNYLCRIFAAFVGRNTSIHWIDGEELGYTEKSGDIYLNRNHEIGSGLSDERRDVFTIGVFVHEMLHQIFSSWTVMEHLTARCKSGTESEIAKEFLNILEDPAIEYRADTVVGGKLLRALRYSINVIYQQSPEITNRRSGLSELLNAMIQFGDMGLIKGKPAHENVVEYLKKILPEMNALIRQSTAEERADAAYRWTQLTRPLWEKDENIEKTISSVNSSNCVQGLPENADGEESDSDGSSSGTRSESEASKRRNAAAKALSGKEEEDNDDEAGAAGKAENKAEEDNDNGNGTGSEKGGENAERRGSAMDNANDTEGGGDQTERPSGRSGAVFVDKDEANEIAFTDVSITDDDIESFEQDISDIRKANVKRETENIQNLDFDVNSRYVTGVRCLNKRLSASASSSAETAYRALVQKNAKAINQLVYSLKDIFNRDQDEMIRASNGKYNIKRGTLGTTVKMFDKKRDCQHVDDIAVFINIDESASMHQSGKIDVARETAVIFAETFSRLQIPLYVMGFTADTEGYSVVHDHYVTWSNTRRERVSLASIHAQCNNMDGYSIRYATETLRRKNAEHKILIQISDGIPAAHKYPSMSVGDADTASAIREAKNVASVFGIGLGDCSPQKLQKFYDGSFVWCRDIRTLPTEAISLFKRIVMSY